LKPVEPVDPVREIDPDTAIVQAEPLAAVTSGT
jgi:hypothetical protein